MSEKVTVFLVQKSRHASAGVSLIEVLVSLVLIGIALGATFKLNNAGLDEMRALKEHHFVQNMVNDLVKKTRVHYDGSLQNIYSVQGAGVAYQDAACIKNCTVTGVARQDMRSWSDELNNALLNFEYNLDVSGDNIMTIGVLWQSRSRDPKVAADCPFENVADKASCFVLVASLDE